MEMDDRTKDNTTFRWTDFIDVYDNAEGDVFMLIEVSCSRFKV